MQTAILDWPVKKKEDSTHVDHNHLDTFAT